MVVGYNNMWWWTIEKRYFLKKKKKIFFYFCSQKLKMTWGVFTERLSYTEFVFIALDDEHEAKHVMRLNVRYYTPVLHVIEYDVIKYSDYVVEIVDGRRKPWSPELMLMLEVHGDFQPNPVVFPRMSPLGTKWKLFDVYFHIQRLVEPNTDVKLYYGYVLRKEWTALVRQFGNVNPLQLRRHLPDLVDENGRERVHPLVHEAFVLNNLSDCMKLCKKVWMTSEDVDGMLCPEDDTWNEVFHRLIDADVIRVCDGLIGFAWAVDAMENLKGVKVEHKENVFPKQVKGPTSEVLYVDYRLPIDKFVDAKCLPSTCLMTTIPSEELRMWNCVSNEKNKMVCYTSFSDAKASLLEMLAETKEQCLSCITVSQSGMIVCEPNGISTVMFTNSVSTFEKDEVVTIQPMISSSANGCKVIGKTRHETIHDDLLFENVRYIGSMTYEEMHRTKKSIDVNYVFVFWNKGVDARFMYEAQQFKTRVVFVMIDSV